MSASNIDTYFGDLPDPRDGDNISHPLINIITITLCAVICGADSWVDVEMFGQAKQSWLSQFLDLRHGIPSHDTIGRFFRCLDPDEFAARFREWASHICERIAGEVVAVDGKQLRRSKDGALGKAGIYMVNVWATKNGLSLAQQKVENHSNEITAIPELLRLLDMEGQIITIDAIGCQTDIVELITVRHGMDIVGQQDATFIRRPFQHHGIGCLIVLGVLNTQDVELGLHAQQPAQDIAMKILVGEQAHPGYACLRCASNCASRRSRRGSLGWSASYARRASSASWRCCCTYASTSARFCR